MSITRECGKTVFIGNSDFSGNVTIKAKDGSSVAVPFEDIKELVGEYFRDQLLNHIEVMSTDDILEIAIAGGLTERARREGAFGPWRKI